MTGCASSGSEDARGPAPDLRGLLVEELERPPGDAALRMAGEVRRRFGGGVAAVLFYGSCLRRKSAEGVLDLYALVDDYRAVYPSRGLARLGALLPPNVHLLRLEGEGTAPALQAKVAVIRMDDFRRAAEGRGIDTRVWARFCQPAVLVWARDAVARHAVHAAVEAATLAAVDRMRCWIPGAEAEQRVAPGELWRRGFAETYRAELRSEREAAIREIVESDPARYARVARAALAVLEQRGRLHVRDQGDRLWVRSDPRARARARRSWHLLRRAAKVRAAAGVVKTAATFDDWPSYVLWKLERQSGVKVQVSERQRRHPWLLGWPVLWRLLRQGALR